MRGALLLLVIMEAAGIALAVFLFGLPIWVPIQVGLLVVALTLKGFQLTGTFIAANTDLGLNFTVFLFGFFIWVSALIGVASILVIATHYASPRPAVMEANDAE